jgi:son of sevenless-like protein
VERLADDGAPRQYLSSQWAAPEGSGGSSSSTPGREATFPSAISRQPDTSRMSAYSDDSDVQPFEHLQTSRPRKKNGSSRHVPTSSSSRPEPNRAAQMELTSAERIAKALQQALQPATPSNVAELSGIAANSIRAVIENVQSHGVARQAEDNQKMDKLIYSAVLAVRNLLYIATAPTNQVPNNLAGNGRDARSHSSSQSPLKPAQRKVTATLSRLVLSARAMQYDSGSQLVDTLNRIETDSEELERAVASFVFEVQRNEHNQPRSEDQTPKRLQGVFTTVNLGLGLVGAGSAGSWKGFGYVSNADDTGMPQKGLGTGVASEIDSSLDRLQEGLNILDQTLRLAGDGPGEPFY